MDLFQRYAWPGNIRELENVVEHAYAFCHQNKIKMQHLPKEYQKEQPKTAAPAMAARSLATETPQAVSVMHSQPQAGEPAHPQAVQPASPSPDHDPDEKSRILQALEAEHWKKTAAAKRLGISRSNLYRKLELYGIE
ncbi:MAG: hypothetical protein HQL62_01815 [Magnetococcales bacterium]|nr:hypothetical protein [Magnetococcales bacterium]